MYLLDTDVLIWAIRGKPEIVGAVNKLKDSASTFLSTISIAEIYKNIFPAEIVKTDELLYKHIIVPVDDKIAKQAGLYWQQYQKRLINLSLNDCLVAATAKQTQLVVVTTNTRHFPMTDIEVLNPLK